MDTNYFTLGEAARVLGIKNYQLAYLVSTGQIPEPMRIAGRRVFTVADLARVSELLKLQLAREVALKGGHHDE